ncbi:hypothetical protein ACLOJK_027096 [Asimina triloba]
MPNRDGSRCPRLQPHPSTHEISVLHAHQQIMPHNNHLTANAIHPPILLPVQRRSTLEPTSIGPIDRPSTTSASHPSALHQQATTTRFQIQRCPTIPMPKSQRTRSLYITTRAAE